MRKYTVNVNGTAYEVEVEEMTGAQVASAAKPVAQAAPQQSTPAPKMSAQEAVAQTIPASAGNTTITAPMPGTILQVSVQVGATVKKGDLLFILEAMKLENEIFASEAGKVTSVNVAKGASVNSGDVLCVIA